MQISRTRGMRFAEKLPSGPVAGAARRDARTDQEGVARWASRRACGTRATPPMAGTAHGERGRVRNLGGRCGAGARSEEHTSELQSLMRISYAVFCLQKKNTATKQET